MKKELTPLLCFVGASIVFPLLSILGIPYNLGKSIYESFKGKFYVGIIKLFTYWIRLVYQLWVAVKYMLYHLAIALDLIANVASGELVEDCVTAKEDTKYGDGDWTISAATGDLKNSINLNKFGVKFSIFLSKCLGKDHCINAYFSKLKETE